jgi:hypothetical protein
MDFYEISLPVLKNVPEINNDDFPIDNKEMKKVYDFFINKSKHYDTLICVYNFSSALFYRYCLKCIIHKFSYEDDIFFSYNLTTMEPYPTNSEKVIEYLRYAFIKSLEKCIEPESKIFIESVLKVWKEYDIGKVLDYIKLYLFTTFTFNKGMDDRKDEKLICNESFDTLQKWISKHTIISNVSISAAVLWLYWNDWCDKHKFTSGSFYNFSQQIKQMYKFKECDYEIYIYCKYKV